MFFPGDGLIKHKAKCWVKHNDIWLFTLCALSPTFKKKTRKSVVRIKAKEFEDVDSEFRYVVYLGSMNDISSEFVNAM